MMIEGLSGDLGVMVHVDEVGLNGCAATKLLSS